MPRILFGDFSTEYAPEEVEDEYQLYETERERTHRDKDVHAFKLLQKLVLQRIGDTSHVSAYTENMHREECAVERHKSQPEVNFGQRIVHVASEHLREPEDDTAENSEQTSTEHNVVNMRHNVVRIVDEDVNWRVCHVDTTQTTNHKH